MIGEIKWAMHTWGLNNADLARKLPQNIREKDLSQILSGKRKPGTAILQSIAKAMGLQWKLVDSNEKVMEERKDSGHRAGLSWRPGLESETEDRAAFLQLSSAQRWDYLMRLIMTVKNLPRGAGKFDKRIIEWR